MEPGHEDREYLSLLPQRIRRLAASMEPGHEDREYVEAVANCADAGMPQWSPAMKTGNTCTPAAALACAARLNGARP